MVKSIILTVYKPFAPLLRRLGFNAKETYELMYWKSVARREGQLANDHYQRIYTSLLGLDVSFYAGKRILDIGCGPRGTLEWADMAAERVGLDPLVESYRALGIDQHKMRYVNAPSEQIPFEDGHFDVILSLNSLDHVDDLDKTIQLSFPGI